MVADDLLVLDSARVRPALQPGDEELVELGTRLLEHLLVCSVTDQQMRKSQRTLSREARPAGPYPFLGGERLEVGIHLAPDFLRQQLGTAPGQNSSPTIAARSSTVARRGSAVEARCQQRTDGGRDGDSGELSDSSPAPAARCTAVVDQHAQDLLKEERIPLGR